MKNLYTFTFLFLSIVLISCSNDDDNTSNDNDDNTITGPAQEEVLKAEINGGDFSNYMFTFGVYEITKGTNANTLDINTADTNGIMIGIFLNETGGFDTGTVKEMGNIDSKNFTTSSTIREQGKTYFSTNGSVTITSNRVHPSEEGHRLISGSFNITAATIDGDDTTSMTGSFNELEYID